MSRSQDVIAVSSLVVAVIACVGGWLAVPQIQHLLERAQTAQPTSTPPPTRTPYPPLVAAPTIAPYATDTRAMDTPTRLPTRATDTPTALGTSTYTATSSDDLHASAFKSLPQGLSVNIDSALYHKAQENNFGFAVSDEYRYPFENEIYVAQVFQKGIAYVKELDWENVLFTDRSSTPVTRDPLANEAFRFSITQHLMTLNPESMLMKEAQIQGLGHPLTSEYEFSFRSKAFLGQLFMGGLLCMPEDGSAEITNLGR